MSKLINIFLEPAKVFAELKEKPTFLVPALVIIAAGALATMLYFLHVDAAWLADHQLKAAAADLSAAELEQAKAFMPGAKVLAVITPIITSLTYTIIFLVMALYYLLAGKVAGNPCSFRHGLSLATWSTMPMLLAAVVTIVGTYTSSNQTSYEQLQLLSIDPLFVQLPMDHDWSMLARSFSLLNFWTWFLAALGWKTWFRTGWGQALFVVMLPSLVIYGVMLLFALI